MASELIAHQVAVTGIGILSGSHADLDGFWRALVEPQGPTATRIEGFDPTKELDRRLRRHTDAFAQLATVAARLARADSAITDFDPMRAAVVVAAGNGTATTPIVEHAHYVEQGPVGVSPLTGVRSMPNAAASAISLDQGARGHSTSIGSGCASGTHAVGEAFRLIRFGLADVVFAGGAESFYAVGADEATAEAAASLRAGLANLKVLSERATARPFDVDRDGFIPADGAAVLVLESFEHARARGARVYAEVCGYGNTNDAHDLLAPEPSGDGIRRAMALALAEAGATPAEVRFVNTHGTGTHSNDLAEARAIRELFGHPGPMVNSIKGVTGHSGAAAGAIEAAAVALAIDRGLVPPTAGLQQVDPALDVDVIHGAPRPWQPGLALSTSLGLGGHNGALALRPAR